MDREIPGSPRSPRPSKPKVYTWDMNNNMFRAFIDLVCSRGHEVEIVNLRNDPSVLCDLWSRSAGNLKFPCMINESEILTYDSDEITRVSADDQPPLGERSAVNLALLQMEDSDLSQSTPQLGFLDKQWNWPVLLLHVIETLGCSVEKGPQELLIPEEFIIDCFKRNLGIELVKDCRIVIFELLNNGMLEEVRQETYKLTYHINEFGLNLCREDFEETLETPSFDKLIPHLVHLMSRIRRFHSIEFLTFVDHTTFLRYFKFNEIIKEETHVALKRLVDLHSILSFHIDVTGEFLEAKRGKYFYAFKGRKLYLRDIACEIRKRISKATRESMEAILWLRWTLSGVPETDQEILEIARDTFIGQYIRADNGSSYVPSFLKSFRPAGGKLMSYDIHISPCLSL